MNVGSAGGVVAREDSQELADSGFVGLGNSAQEGFVVGCTVRSRGPAIVDLNGIGVDSGVAGVCSGSIARLWNLLDMVTRKNPEIHTQIVSQASERGSQVSTSMRPRSR